MIQEEVLNLLHDLRVPMDMGHWAHRLRSDPMFAVEMRVCREWRIPHSEFLGWDSLDREKALAFVIHEGQRCKECGIHGEDWPTEVDPAPFEVYATRCFGCQAVAQWMDDHRKATTRKGEPDPKAIWGLRTTLRPSVEG